MLVARKRIKSALGALLFRSGLYRKLLRGRAVIALFHRIDDSLVGNPITCSRKEFVEYCEFFRQYFIVVSFSELLDRIRAGRDISRHLVITFDDGYKDNYEIAAAELTRRRLPACFFVATNFIESNAVPWWDAEVGIRPEWMSWREVRAMRDAGFEIGAHTMNHADLGKVDATEARREILGSKDRLESELGEKVTLFSYPYGRPDQITETARDVVRSAGFRCCVSAFGGTVQPNDDPFRLKRQPISDWFISRYQFGFEVLRN